MRMGWLRLVGSSKIVGLFCRISSLEGWAMLHICMSYVVVIMVLEGQTPWNIRHDLFIRLEWLVHTCDMKHLIQVFVLHHTYEGVMPRIWKSYITHVKRSCHTSDAGVWRQERIHLGWMNSLIEFDKNPLGSFVLHNMKESCPTYEWATSHIWMSHVTHLM